jgi:hypothetical protein
MTPEAKKKKRFRLRASNLCQQSGLLPSRGVLRSRNWKYSFHYVDWWNDEMLIDFFSVLKWTAVDEVLFLSAVLK